MKKKKNDTEKPYIIVKEKNLSYGFDNHLLLGELIYVDTDELITYIKENGQKNIKKVLKNELINIETVVNINR